VPGRFIIRCKEPRMTAIARIVTALVLCSCCAAPLHAQRPLLAAGFKLGPSFASLETNQFGPLPRSLTTVTGGGFLRLGYGAYAIQPELLATTRGARFRGQGVTRLSLDYIELPVLLVAQLPFGVRSRPWVLAGPAFASETGCTVEITSSTAVSEHDCDGPDFSENRRTTDISAVVGAGLQLPLGPGTVLVEGRYNHGLMNLITEPASARASSRAASILLSYMVLLRAE
jgi:hypothetical protein